MTLYRLPSGTERLFLGLHLDEHTTNVAGTLVRVWGHGYNAVGDVLATASLEDDRIAQAIHEEPHERLASQVVAELTSPVIGSLLAEARADDIRIRVAALRGFGRWECTPLDEVLFRPRCDTQLLAAQCGLTIIDDFVAADQAQGGRGGPLEATGAWLLFGDRGLVPGRTIRAFVELGPAARLMLLPPRQNDRLPNHLMSFDIVPASSLLDGIVNYIHATEQTGRRGKFDPKEQLAVQSKKIPELAEAWDAQLPQPWQSWSPLGPDAAPLINIIRSWPEPLAHRGGDLLCTAIHWIAKRIGQFVDQNLPPSQPIGQLVLGGELRGHSFLRQQLMAQIPAVNIRELDELGEAEYWRPAATAMLGMLSIDQMPANSASLTGTRSPRVLGRITAGRPSNWHRVLADLSDTLPDKKTLRSAV